MSAEDIGVSAQEEKKNSKAPAAKASPAPSAPFASIPTGRALVLVPEDLNERNAATGLLEEALTAPGAKQPRVFTSIKLSLLDESFQIFTAIASRTRGVRTLKLSAPTSCGAFLTEVQAASLGDDIDFGVTSEPVKALDLPSIVNSIQKAVGPNWRVSFSNGNVRLLNT